MAPTFGKRQGSDERPRLADVTTKRVNQDPRRIRCTDSLTPSIQEPQRPDSDRNTQRIPMGEDNNSPAIDNKHLSALIDSHRDPKRDSQLSVSTNATIPLHPAQKRKSHIGSWRLGTTLGKGATCRVRKAKHETSGTDSAVKILYRKTASTHRSESVLGMDRLLAKHTRFAPYPRIPFGIEREILLMKLMSHPNIIKLYDIWENRGEMYLVLEFVEGGELFDYVVERGLLAEAEAVRLFRQLLSALGHCHGLRLCHRDIKPENILVDSNGNVKIADFGMASVQHAEYLHTSCGSPHYAAPEVAQGLPYKGERADIWSLGVVLYVMLTGTVPFGACIDTNDPDTRDDNVRIILEEVVQFDVMIPESVSDEAEDLILHMLTKDPDLRPLTAWIWDHPLLQKYGSHARHPQGPGEWSDSPEPEITRADCGPPLRDASEIDQEILDNLCLLLHTTDHTSITMALLSPDCNFEQIFYHRLLRHQSELKERFPTAGIAISPSDYHHVGRRRLRNPSTKKAIPGPLHTRQRSQFSIADTNTRKSSGYTKRTFSEAGTERSYDPFRASRRQLPTSNAEYAKVTVIQSSPALLNGPFEDTRSFVVRNPAIERIRDLSNSGLNSSSGGSAGALGSASLSQGYSITSLGSSIRSCTSSQRGRRSGSYKRGVRFPHRHRRSAIVPVSSKPGAPSPLTVHRPPGRDSWLTMSSMQPEPTLPVKSRKEDHANSEGAANPQKANRLSAYLTEEARHVSRELGQFCDDAFRESFVQLNERPYALGGSQAAKAPRAYVPEDKAKLHPPPRKSSRNQQANGNAPENTDQYRQRPLPAPPAEKSSTDGTLQKLLNAQAALVAEAASMPPEELKTSLAAINRMIDGARDGQKREEARRLVSAPSDTRAAKDRLPFGRDDTEAPRHVSEPTRGIKGQDRAAKSYGRDFGRSTIRVVNDSDMKPAPLTVRKKCSGASMNSRFTSNNPSSLLSVDGYNANEARYGSVDCGEALLETIAEDDKENQSSFWPKRGSKEGKFKNIFRWSGSSKSTDSDCGPPPPSKDVYPTPQLTQPSPSRLPIDEISDDLEFEEVALGRGSRRRGFLSFFGWKSSGAIRELTVFEDGNESTSALSSTLTGPVFNNTGPNNRSNISVANAKNVRFNGLQTTPHLPPEPRNWFSKFLRAKPARSIVALHMSQTAALKEVRAIFKDWKRHGVRDIVSDRAAGKIWAHVDAHNSLNIKPVSISVEFFTVLQRGRKNNLCVARFLQNGGARTSFARVVRTMKDVLGGRDLLVLDTKKAREMRRCLSQWETS